MTKIKYLLLLALLQLACCTSKTPSASIPEINEVVIFVPGYYGSALRNVETKKRYFLTARSTFFGNEALSLYPELLTPASPNLEVDGVLDKISFFLYDYDIYQNFMSSLKLNPQTKVVGFAYDWRKDLPLAAKQLSQLVENLQSEGIKKIHIVAHSMGGLVTAYYLGYGSQDLESAKLNWAGARKIQSVSFVAVPFKGSFLVFRNMNRGADLAVNPKMLPAETVASFPASYQITPFSTVHLKQKNQISKSIDLGDADFWIREGFGLLGNKNLPEPIQMKRQEFTKHQLARARQFSRLINFEGITDFAPTQLKVLNIIANGQPTVATAFHFREHGKDLIVYDRDDLKKYDVEATALQEEGDGSVVVTSAQLPMALAEKSQTVFTKAAHLDVLSNKVTACWLKKNIRDVSPSCEESPKTDK